MSDNLKWDKKETLGVKTNVMEPLLVALKETLKHEKNELETRLRNLKMLGVIATDGKINLEDIKKNIEGLK